MSYHQDGPFKIIFQNGTQATVMLQKVPTVSTTLPYSVYLDIAIVASVGCVILFGVIGPFFKKYVSRNK